MGRVVRVVFVGQDRPVWKVVLLYIVTLGIYRRVWLYKVNKEIDGHAALGLNHGLNLFLLILPVVGPSIVTFQTAHRLNHNLEASRPLAYGPTWALWLATLVPILGNGFFLGWTQDRLNKYWPMEKDNPEHAIDIDKGLEKDKKFLVELKEAQKRSYEAGSRFDRKKQARRERWAARARRLREIRAERAQVRAAGGSTPVLPWLPPDRPTPRELHVTCGRCDTGFDVTQDPFADTPLLCPKCGLTEVLPSLRSDGLAGGEKAAFAGLEVDCPKCQTHFHATRRLDGPTEIQCYECGHKETLPAPKAAEAS